MDIFSHSNRGDSTGNTGNWRGKRRNRADTYRWRNVPVPEAHVAGLVVGLALHAFRPRRVTLTRQPSSIAGWSLIGVGVLLGAWAVRAAGSVDTKRPSELVTTGPFAYSRNPMYIAWTALYVGVAVVVNTVWVFVLLPLVMAATHITVRREERTLERAFGDDFRDYKNEVRRYL